MKKELHDLKLPGFEKPSEGRRRPIGIGLSWRTLLPASGTPRREGLAIWQREQLKSSRGRSSARNWKATIDRLRGEKFTITGGVKSKNGVLLSHETDILRRWSKHFSELLNPYQGTERDRLEVLRGAENSPTV